MFSQLARQVARAATTRQPSGVAAIAVRAAHHGADDKMADPNYIPVSLTDPYKLSPGTFPPKHIADQDDLPQVGGSWQEYIDERNAGWNKQLAISAVLFVTIAVTIQQTVFFNAFAPELPEEMKNYHPWKDRKE
ncbi:unnamed protein product [Bemisia tabaci]|uniref:Deltamethrin resistance protein prag01 domain-containing protein n=1 Tax=Bemisia tabaci TaxID=7038 RepID=A0A9P0A5Y8_BEMTA|nr:PREDICTED: uncharacterized protein LOC109034276 [Bemisia tabaci]CAH0385292.1 unnamed protein product [Bemisia tabaci]